MKKSYYVIPHVHWDREWYFTEQKSQLYLLNDLDEVLDTLEEHPEIRTYVFDAQTSLIEDYLKYHPQKEIQLKKLIKEKRLLTGPWYTQCDQMVVHGESIVRNLIYGITEANSLGHCFMVGYAPDCFGMAEQMPQIFNEFGIKYAIIKRGIETSKIPYDEFVWKSDDNGAVTTYHCNDYLNFRNPSNNVLDNISTINQLEAFYNTRSKTKIYLLFNGFDQHPIRKDIGFITNELANFINIKIDDPESILNEINRYKKCLPIFNDEMTCGETARVHKSIYSSRADIKVLNSKVENKMIRIIEPLQAYYYELTGHQEKILLKDLWKLIMKNSAHDSIGTCNTDQVNEEIKQRFLYILETLKQYEELTYREIANQIKQDEYSIQIYNYLPYDRMDTVNIEILSPYKVFSLKDSNGSIYHTEIKVINEVTQEVKEYYRYIQGANNSYRKHYIDKNIYKCEISALVKTPSMGYETFSIIPEKDRVMKAEQFENKFLKIAINQNGSVNIYDKHTHHNYEASSGSVGRNESLIWQQGRDI